MKVFSFECRRLSSRNLSESEQPVKTGTRNPLRAKLFEWNDDDERGTTWTFISRKHRRSKRTMETRNVKRSFGIDHHSLLGGFPSFEILFLRTHSQADTHVEQHASCSAKVGNIRERDLVFVFNVFEQTCIHPSCTWSNVCHVHYVPDP